MKNQNGGIIPETLTEKSRAGKVDLITLPRNITGTNCGNCAYFKNDFCYHVRVRLSVNDRMCCALWDATGTIRNF